MYYSRWLLFRRPIQDSHDFATRRQLVRSVIQDIGPSLVAGALKACMFDIPRSMVRHSAEVFFELLAMDRAVSSYFVYFICKEKYQVKRVINS